MGAFPEHRRGADQVLAGHVRPVGQRTGVQAEQGQTVAQDVVDLAGHLVPGLASGLFGAAARLGLGLFGAFAQRDHELLAVLQVQAPADGGGQQERALEDGLGHGVADAELRAQEGVGERGDDTGAEQGQADLGRAARADGEHRHQHGAGDHLQVGREPDEDQCQAERPSASEPQRDAGQQPDGLVEVEQPDGDGAGGVGVLHTEPGDQHTVRGGSDEQPCVDGPVPGGATGRVRAVGVLHRVQTTRGGLL